jgi:hypothetical protein
LLRWGSHRAGHASLRGSSRFGLSIWYGSEGAGQIIWNQIRLFTLFRNH